MSADDKAAKVAALSQALDFIDKFRKSQESKEDKTGGPDEEEINDLATNLQEASQGAPTKSNQTLHIVGGKANFPLEINFLKMNFMVLQHSYRLVL